MKLYLTRHAIAEDEPRDEDHLRPLTEEGREKFEQVVDGLDALGVRVDKLLYSPWLRAVETAELMSKLVAGDTQVCAQLAEPPGRGLLAELKGDPIALVGHQPWKLSR
ncbi:MAG: histidine phosphatase family protein [Myxococcaceae bacterium]